MGLRVGCVLLLTACYSPSYTESLPCSETGKCPPGQECDPIGQVCVAEPSDAPRFLAVTAGGRFTCAIRTDRTLWCWGENRQGQLGDNSFTSRGTPAMLSLDDWTAISAGADTVCGLRGDGELWCWGAHFETSDASDPVPKRVGTQTGWRTLDVSATHACAIDSDSHLWCWGRNSNGEVGVGDTQPHLAPVRVDDERWLAVAAGDTHTCGIRMDRSLWCFGSDQGGELGNGPTVMPSHTPARTSTGPWEQVDTFDSHTCVIDPGGNLGCWGYFNNTVDLGPSIVPLDGYFLAVAVGEDAVAVLRGDGRRVGIGDGEYYQRGDAIRSPIEAPDLEPRDPRVWKALAQGGRHGCGIREDDTLWCWGGNDAGQLGQGTIGRKLAPVQIGTNAGWTQVSVAAHHACGVDNGDLYCWGDNEFGQLGTGKAVPLRRATRIGEERVWRSVNAGYNHSCAIDENQSLWCWGENRDGELGTGGTGGGQLLPTKIGTRMWERVAGGSRWTCGVSGSLWCWGRNRGNTPRETEPSTGWLDISLEKSVNSAQAVGVNAAGGWSWSANDSANAVNTTPQVPWTTLQRNDGHSCGIQAGGTLWCIGRNSRGQLGNGTNQDVNTGFLQIAMANSWTRVTAGSEHSCAIANDRAMWCWGRNSEGELGIGSTDDEYTPTRLDGEWLEVSGGESVTCGIRADHTLWCWGANEHGEVGDGDGSSAGPLVVR